MQESSASEVLIVHRSIGLLAHLINRVTHLPLCCGAHFQPIQWIIFEACHENFLILEVVEGRLTTSTSTITSKLVG